MKSVKVKILMEQNCPPAAELNFFTLSLFHFFTFTFCLLPFEERFEQYDKNSVFGARFVAGN
jgi:hypothetical protein